MYGKRSDFERLVIVQKKAPFTILCSCIIQESNKF